MTFVKNPPPKAAVSLLEPEDKGLSDFIVPGLLGVLGAAILYKTFSDKDEKKKKKESTPEASDDEVKFSKNYTSYTVGKDWEATVLEP